MAGCKIITYDLRSPGRNYDDLYNAIKSYGTYTKLTESTWVIKTVETCEQVRDKLITVVDSNDALFVAALTGEAAWYGLPGAQSTHLLNTL